MSVVLRAIKECAAKAKDNPAVLVAFSGGKDSLAVLDLCLRFFARAECFHLEFAPGLRVTHERVIEPLARLKVPCRFYRDPLAIEALRNGVYCDQTLACDRLKKQTANDVYKLAMADSGIDLVATGKKYADYRQRAFHMRGGRILGWHPLREWKKANVLSYLASRNIEPPKSHGEAVGIDLTNASLLWLHETYPDDFQLMLKWFPYAQAVIERSKAKS